MILGEKQEGLHLLLCLESLIASIQVKCTLSGQEKQIDQEIKYFFLPLLLALS